jgi:hypothetical protein
MEDYKERYVKEYEELIARLDKLHTIILKATAGTLPFKLNCPLELLREQERSMMEYARALIRRSHYEKVELNTEAFISIFLFDIKRLRMNFEKEWKNTRDLFINKLKNGDFSFETVKPYLSNFEEIKPYVFVKVNDEWFDYYINPFTGIKKKVLDKNDYLFKV